MANIPNGLHHALGTSCALHPLPWAVFLVLGIFITIVFSLAAARIVRSQRQVAALTLENAILQDTLAACKKAFDEFVDEEYAHLAQLKTTLDVGLPSPPPTPAPAPVPVPAPGPSPPGADSDSNSSTDSEAKNEHERESERNEALMERLDFVQASSKIVLGQKNREIAALKVKLAAATRTVAKVTAERDAALARADAVAHQLAETRADYGGKVAALTTRATEAEAKAATLEARTATLEAEATALGGKLEESGTKLKESETKLEQETNKNARLDAELSRVRGLYNYHVERSKVEETTAARINALQGAEIVQLKKRLEPVLKPRARRISALSSTVRFSFQSLLSRRSSETETETEAEIETETEASESFDSDQSQPEAASPPPPPRRNQFTIRLSRKARKA